MLQWLDGLIANQPNDLLASLARCLLGVLVCCVCACVRVSVGKFPSCQHVKPSCQHVKREMGTRRCGGSLRPSSSASAYSQGLSRTQSVTGVLSTIFVAEACIRRSSLMRAEWHCPSKHLAGKSASGFPWSATSEGRGLSAGVRCKLSFDFGMSFVLFHLSFSPSYIGTLCRGFLL